MLKEVARRLRELRSRMDTVAAAMGRRRVSMLLPGLVTLSALTLAFMWAEKILARHWRQAHLQGGGSSLSAPVGLALLSQDGRGGQFRSEERRYGECIMPKAARQGYLPVLPGGHECARS